MNGNIVFSSFLNQDWIHINTPNQISVEALRAKVSSFLKCKISPQKQYYGLSGYPKFVPIFLKYPLILSNNNNSNNSLVLK